MTTDKLKALLKSKRELTETYCLLLHASRDGFTVDKELEHDIKLRRATVESVEADRAYQVALDEFIALDQNF